MEPKRSSWVARHQLLSFFILAYAFTWAIAFITMASNNVPSHSIVMFIMLLGPTISAFIISALAGGKDGIKKLLSGFTRWKIGFKWYLATITLTLVPLLVALVYIALGNHVKGIAPGSTITVLLTNLLFTLLFGPLAEETGWRGFALPRLQKKFNALVSSLILGVIWACWHIPFYVISGGGSGIPFPIYMILVISITIFITWIYNNSKGNLVLCILAHFCFNFNSAFLVGFLGLLPPMVFYISCGAGLGLLIVLILFSFGPKRLSKNNSIEQTIASTTI